MRPIAACAMVVVERTRVSQVTPESPGIPRAMVLTVSFVLSPGTGLSCPRRPRTCIRELDTSVGVSGPHDFAVRFSAVRQERIRVHRIPPRVRDDREPPLCGTGRAELVEMICPTGKAEYFCKGGWTGKSLICPSGKSNDVHDQLVKRFAVPSVTPGVPRGDRMRRRPPLFALFEHRKRTQQVGPWHACRLRAQYSGSPALRSPSNRRSASSWFL
jgi:hypothetical protein